MPMCRASACGTLKHLRVPVWRRRKEGDGACKRRCRVCGDADCSRLGQGGRCAFVDTQCRAEALRRIWGGGGEAAAPWVQNENAGDDRAAMAPHA